MREELKKCNVPIFCQTVIIIVDHESFQHRSNDAPGKANDVLYLQGSLSRCFTNVPVCLRLVFCVGTNPVET